ncbi:hypothetical protein SMNI109538_02205 [Smaragdicoccus niigatensis]
MLGLESGRIWVGILGHISERKNPDLIIRAMLGLQCGEFGLMVAGSMTQVVADKCEPLLRAFQDQGGAVVRIDGYLDNETFDRALESVDVTVIAHSNEGASGILGRSLAVGVLPIVAGPPGLKRYIRNFPASLTAPLSIEGIREALLKVKSILPAQPIEVSGADDFFEQLIAR